MDDLNESCANLVRPVVCYLIAMRDLTSDKCCIYSEGSYALKLFLAKL